MVFLNPTQIKSNINKVLWLTQITHYESPNQRRATERKIIEREARQIERNLWKWPKSNWVWHEQIETYQTKCYSWTEMEVKELQ